MLSKKYKIAVIGLFSFVFSGFSQETKANFNLYIAFDLSFNFTSSKSYNEVISSKILQFDKIQKEYNIVLTRSILFSEEKMAVLSKNALAISGNDISVRKLNNIFKIDIENPTSERLNSLSNTLKTLSGIEYVSSMSVTPIKPPGDIAPTTPDFETNQTYLETNPGENNSYAGD